MRSESDIGPADLRFVSIGSPCILFSNDGVVSQQDRVEGVTEKAEGVENGKVEREPCGAAGLEGDRT